ncbi:DnaJ sub C member 21 [Cyanidiococcus yangmingshanensis]|uniref:DnaJ sub C member 21 n=1 Tax=Cyanidiococcus yangmingshanensis TaxID=2690220 RepID=A0A7J7INI8_9RHOD|nr:DnaJ sub C member 21 [Cyanidiococcus yangmingshanensis]
MKCLASAREATAEEITRAFRKAALRLHPDKNPDRAEEAAEEFKELRRAYEVLSDPHERKWYDDHREDILRGRDPLDAANESTGDAGMTNQGFCRVYGDVFDQLAQEEVDAGGARPPPFGSMTTEWRTVRRFYNSWENFVSAKSFAFADIWNPNEAPNRETRRAMERENRRERERARREFQTLVRELVAFVKKRDRRVLKHKEEEARREAEKMERQAQEQEQRGRMRALHAARLAAQLEEDLPNLDELLEHLEYAGAGAVEQDDEFEHANVSEDTEAPLIDGVQCLACKKQFKTFAQWKNHENSKKHRDRVRQFRRELCLARDEARPVRRQRMKGLIRTPVAEMAGGRHSSQQRNIRNPVLTLPQPMSHSRIICRVEADSQAGASTTCASITDAEWSRSAVVDGDDELKSESHLVSDRGAEKVRLGLGNDTDGEVSPRAFQDSDGSMDSGRPGEANATTPACSVSGAAAASHLEEDDSPQRNKSRAKTRRRRAQTAKDRRHVAADETTKTAHACQTCHSVFPSRNALFRHIREENHAQYR